MIDRGYDIVCGGCRTTVPSTASSCPRCGSELGGGSATPRIAATPATSPAFEYYPLPARVALAETSRYGGFWIRVLAWFIDSLVLGIPYGVIAARWGLSLRPLGPIGWAYYAMLESSSAQATIGKLVCGLKVTDLEGRRISFLRALGRYPAKVLLGSLTLGVGLLMIAWSDRKRGLHDFVAGTLVVRS